MPKTQTKRKAPNAGRRAKAYKPARDKKWVLKVISDILRDAWRPDLKPPSPEIPSGLAMPSAADRGRLSNCPSELKTLAASGFNFTIAHMNFMALKGWIDGLKFVLKTSGYPRSAPGSVFTTAIIFRQIELLEWLVTKCKGMTPSHLFMILSRYSTANFSYDDVKSVWEKMPLISREDPLYGALFIFADDIDNNYDELRLLANLGYEPSFSQLCKVLVTPDAYAYMSIFYPSFERVDRISSWDTEKIKELVDAYVIRETASKRIDALLA